MLIWTNTFANLDKYRWQFGQIHSSQVDNGGLWCGQIWTFFNLDKYIWVKLMKTRQSAGVADVPQSAQPLRKPLVDEEELMRASGFIYFICSIVHLYLYLYLFCICVCKKNSCRKRPHASRIIYFFCSIGLREAPFLSKKN